jgi:hypothetical protein
MAQRDPFRATRGPGSGFVSIFGRTFVRLEEEGENGGGGGGEGAGSGGETPPKETLYTAAQVEEIVRRRLDRAKPKAPEPEKKPAKTDGGDPTWVFDLQDAIDAQTEARGVKVPLGLKKRMRSAFAAERPSDPSAWVGNWLDDVGLQKTVTPDPNPKPDGKPDPKPPAAAPTSPGAVNPLLSGEDVDVTKLTGKQLEELGPAKVRELFDKQRAKARAAGGEPPLPRALRQARQRQE